jgi:hypothetical protein
MNKIVFSLHSSLFIVHLFQIQADPDTVSTLLISCSVTDLNFRTYKIQIIPKVK